MQFKIFFSCGELFSVLLLHSSFAFVKLFCSSVVPLFRSSEFSVPFSAPQTVPFFFDSSFPLVSTFRQLRDGGVFRQQVNFLQVFSFVVFVLLYRLGPSLLGPADVIFPFLFRSSFPLFRLFRSYFVPLFRSSFRSSLFRRWGFPKHRYFFCFFLLIARTRVYLALNVFTYFFSRLRRGDLRYTKKLYMRDDIRDDICLALLCFA